MRFKEGKIHHIGVSNEIPSGVSEYVKQAEIGATMATEKRPQWKVALRLTGPTVEGQQTATARPANDYELIEAVTRHLEGSGQLRTTRPRRLTMRISSAPFILESMKARKVIFACDESIAPRGLQEIAVRVSNPIERPFAHGDDRAGRFEAAGMFVYLLEAYWADGPVHRASMMTALNKLLSELRHAAAKNAATRISVDTSRDDYASPVDILLRHGGIKGDSRAITALYRMRTVSQNKIVNVGGSTLRCHDLFGYPIYITTAT